MKISQEISKSKNIDLAEFNRVIEVFVHYKFYEKEQYIVPFELIFLGASGAPVADIPSKFSSMEATNFTKVFVDSENFKIVAEAGDGIIEMGQYDYFEKLQKHLSDSEIIKKQILILDSEGFFDKF